MDLRKETRRVALVPLVDDLAVIEFDPEVEWIESTSTYNESFIQVIFAGVVNA